MEDITIVITLCALAVAGLAGLAKRRSTRRKMGQYIKGNIDLDVSLGTLASRTGIVTSTSDVVNETTLVSSVQATYSLSGATSGDNIGPCQVGIAHPDYSLAEIEAWIEQTSSWNVADLVAQETSNRKIRRVGTLGVPAAVGETSVLNDGKPIKTKLNWLIYTAQGLGFWIYNDGGAAFATTDPNFHVEGHANLWPR